MKCGIIVMEDGVLCNDCFKTVTFCAEGIGYCDVCGKKISSGYKENEICASCLSNPPKYAKLRAAVKYNYNSKPMILAFKHGDRTEFAKPFAKWMVASYIDIKNNDLIIPVPLHRTRLLKRKYNQAALLSQEVAKITEIEWDGKSLLRIKNTQSQGRYRPSQRRQNVKKAFKIKNNSNIKGKNILLIDDVYTSGATTDECIKTLLENGAKSVNILVYAKT